MANTIKLLDVVALTVALPEYNLRRGQVGTVVDILAEGSAFEVDFCDREGRTFESLGLRAEQILVLRYEPVDGNFEKEIEAAAPRALNSARSGMFIETRHQKFYKLRRSEMFSLLKLQAHHSNSTCHSYGVHELLESESL